MSWTSSLYFSSTTLNFYCGNHICPTNKHVFTECTFSADLPQTLVGNVLIWPTWVQLWTHRDIICLYFDRHFQATCMALQLELVQSDCESKTRCGCSLKHTLLLLSKLDHNSWLRLCTYQETVHWGNKWNEKWSHFLISWYTITPIFETNGVKLCWSFEKMT